MEKKYVDLYLKVKIARILFNIDYAREKIIKATKKIIKTNNRICVEGRDIASKILARNPRYDLAFYL